MHCPNENCKSKHLRVLETSGQSHPNLGKIERFAISKNLNPDCVVMRRKICLDCGERFVTFEYVVDEKEEKLKKKMAQVKFLIGEMQNLDKLDNKTDVREVKESSNSLKSVPKVEIDKKTEDEDNED